MGKRGPKPKFTDVARPNEACKNYGVAGHGNIMGNGTYQARNTTIADTSAIVAGKRSMIVQTLSTIIFAKVNPLLI